MKNLVISFLLVCLPLDSFSNKAQSLESNTYCVSEDRSCNTSLTDSCVECQPLMWFVNRTEIIPNTSTIIVFFPGEHKLNSKKHKAYVQFHNKTNLTLTGIENLSVVMCSGGRSGFLFENSSYITVMHLHFQGCGVSHQDDSHGAILFNQSYTIQIIQVWIINSTGFGLFLNNCLERITIEHSNLVGNGAGIYAEKLDRHPFFPTSSKNMKLQDAGGLILFILQGRVNASLTDITFTNNTGETAGNIGIKLTHLASLTTSVTLSNCTIEKGHSFRGGGGLKIYFKPKTYKRFCNYNMSNYRKTFIITNTVFQENTARVAGGGVQILYGENFGISCSIRKTEFINCSFSYNTASQGSAIIISKRKIPPYVIRNAPQFLVTLKDCQISNNNNSNEQGAVKIFSAESTVIIRCIFTNNTGTALVLVNSAVRFYNESVFSNNSAQYGGAIKLVDYSVIYLDNYTRIAFLNNTAQFSGGAIYYAENILRVIPPCFFDMPFAVIDELARGILYFEGNSAGRAGHAIYGGTVDNCYTVLKLRTSRKAHIYSFYFSFELYQQIFQFSNLSKLSLVTSDPYSVCMCDNITGLNNCSIRNVNLKGYAGQKQVLYISAVGQLNGSTPSQLAIEPNTKSNYKIIRQNTYNISSIPLCQKVEVVVYPEKNVTSASFQIDIQQTNTENLFFDERLRTHKYNISKLTINMTILPCPFPFKLSWNNSCDCPQGLMQREFETVCDINTETITRPKHTDSEWVGYLHNGTVFAASKKCQRGHCKQGGFPRSIHNLSDVCVEGREGRICGRCASGYTLSLGPPNCINTRENCSNWKSFLLLLSFFFSGILLVFIISILNLTVTMGTINGLLFYANCIQENKEVFFFIPKIGLSNHSAIAFISWLNLDSGFQNCLYSGMTAYQKQWLEFGFLLYLFLLGALIVYLSRKFIWFTRLAGRNVVPVLSTLILLAYPKLVGNSIQVWHCRNEKYWASDNSTPWMWHSDETIDCFTGKHIVLFVVSILMFTTALLYALSLLFIQCLQRGSGWCVLRWVNKLRPFFDANTGPCRDQYRFWPGFLLTVRLGVYAAVVGLTDVKERSYVILGLCVIIFFLACVFPNGVYKKWPLNLLEFSFLLNLSIGMGVAAAISDKYFRVKMALGNASISIALITFILIMVYHSYLKIKETKVWKNMQVKFNERKSKFQHDNYDHSHIVTPNQEIFPECHFIALRESILED